MSLGGSLRGPRSAADLTVRSDGGAVRVALCE
jgi:hypothetical protein